MSAENLISRLEKVRAIAPDRWIAACPSHDDRSPSLSIRVVDDKVLVHCFGGCDALSIVQSVGLSLGHLFESGPTGKHAHKPTKPNHWHAAREALRVLSHESLIVAIAGENIANGIELSDDDRDRVLLAASRIRAAQEAVK